MYESSTAHLTPQTGLIPALNAWEMYLNDQGRSFKHRLRPFYPMYAC